MSNPKPIKNANPQEATYANCCLIWGEQFEWPNGPGEKVVSQGNLHLPHPGGRCFADVHLHSSLDWVTSPSTAAVQWAKDKSELLSHLPSIGWT